MKDMTREQIKARLAEIAGLQADFDARDFDAELSQAIVNGSDVDALEEQHLQAERVARRLRVERQALEHLLPKAEQNEAEARIAALAESHAETYRKFEKAAEKVASHIEKLEIDFATYHQLYLQMHRVAQEMLTERGSLEKRTGEQVSLPAIFSPNNPRLDNAFKRIAPVGQQIAACNVSRHQFGFTDALVYKTEEGEDAAAAA